jgi:hydrogenase expression/formation protein HypC
MCLGIPGRVVETYEQDDLPMGKVEFGGILKEVCLAYTPEAKVGQYVLVHVGFAISLIDQTEAAEIFSCLEEIGEVMRQSQQTQEDGEETPLPLGEGWGEGSSG